MGVRLLECAGSGRVRKAYFKALEISPSKKLVVTTPRYIAALDGLREQIKPARWAPYFTYHLLAANVLALPRAFDDEALALEKLVTGVIEKPARSKRCIGSTKHALGELLGRAYVEKHVPASAKKLASELVEAITAVMHDHLGALDWMSAPTRTAAQGKLGKLVEMIGFPEKWRSYDVVVNRHDYPGNRLRTDAAERRYKLGKSGKPVDRAEWVMNAFEVNAYYNPLANNTALLAAVLQPPFFLARPGRSRRTWAPSGTSSGTSRRTGSTIRGRSSMAAAIS